MVIPVGQLRASVYSCSRMPLSVYAWRGCSPIAGSILFGARSMFTRARGESRLHGTSDGKPSGGVTAESSSTSASTQAASASNSYTEEFYAQFKDAMDKLVKENKVVLVMKGTPEEPKCGFSKRVVTMLNDCGLKEYKFVNVLPNAAIREAVKRYSHWPTIPQLYVGGEFIGGCDIATEMNQSGELKTLLQSSGAV